MTKAHAAKSSKRHAPAGRRRTKPAPPRDDTPPPRDEPAPPRDEPAAGLALSDPAPAALLPIPTPQARAVEQLLRWIAKGASPLEQAEALQRHFPEADPQAVYAEALNQVAALADPHPELTRGFCFLAAQEIHRRAIETGDLSAGLRALRFLSQLAAAASPSNPEPPAPTAG